MFVEPIIDYTLVAVVLSAEKQATGVLNELDKLQSSYLRMAAGVGNYVSNKELHQIFRILPVATKVGRMCHNEWTKIDFNKSFKPEYRISRNKYVYSMENLLDRMYFYKTEYEEFMKTFQPRAFDIDEYNLWKEEMRVRLKKIMIKSRPDEQRKQLMRDVQNEYFSQQ